MDPSTMRRALKRQFGMTFLELARQRRLREGFETLVSGEKVINAQIDAGFESPSAFRAAFARLLGCAPNELKPGRFLCASWIATPLGDMVAVASPHHLHLLEFVDRKALPTELRKLQSTTNEPIGLGSPAPIEQAKEELDAYFAARSAVFETPLYLAGSAFARRVWSALREIPPGETRS
jgi:AraC family transcriptional regulator of adaptative response/methylated-DNA-[protein]-cysteine methyltransferase